MAFTYTGDPAGSNRDKVRFLVQDTVNTGHLLEDEEIAWLISEWADVYDAAAHAADILAAKFAGQADYSKSVGDLSLSETHSAQVERYHQIGVNLRLMRQRRYVPTWVANSDSLKSTADRDVDTYNTDSYLGQFDNPRGSSEGTSIE